MRSKLLAATVWSLIVSVSPLIPVVTAPARAAASCSGIQVKPDHLTQALVDSKSPGTTFCLLEGTHRPAAPIIVKSHDTFEGVGNAVVAGGGQVSTAFVGFAGHQDSVTIRHLEIRGFTGSQFPGALKPGADWLVRGNYILHNRVLGVEISPGLRLIDNRIVTNGQYGISGGIGLHMGVRIEGNEIAYNNTRHLSDGGGSKLYGSTVGLTGIVWRNNWVHHNHGPGIWSDGNAGPGIEVVGNRVEWNTGPGILIEISHAHRIHGNVVRFNNGALAGKSCWWGAQILVQNSNGVQIYRNKVVDRGGTNGICLVDSVRDETAPFGVTIRRVSVHDNRITMRGSSQTGLVGDEFAPYDRADAAFDHNTYRVPVRRSWWVWWDGARTWRRWHHLRQDETGTLVKN
jgi:hypothetical protein